MGTFQLLQMIIAIAVILAIFFLPWLYMGPTVSLPVVQSVLDTVANTLESLAPAPVPQLIAWARSVSSPSAWKLLSFDLLSSWVRFVILLPLVVAVTTLILALAATWRSSAQLATFAGWIGTTAGGLALVLLIFYLPQLERLGMAGNYLAGVGTALLGVRLAWGYWITLIVLALFVAASLATLLDNRTTRHRATAPRYYSGNK